jgi:hypothetical protein
MTGSLSASVLTSLQARHELVNSLGIDGVAPYAIFAAYCADAIRAAVSFAWPESVQEAELLRVTLKGCRALAGAGVFSSAGIGDLSGDRPRRRLIRLLAEIGEISRVGDRYGRSLTRGVIVDATTTIILSSTPSEMLLDELGAGAATATCGVLRYAAAPATALVKTAPFGHWLRLFDYTEWWHRFAPSILRRLSEGSESSLIDAEVASFSAERGTRWEPVKSLPTMGRYLLRYRDTSFSERVAVAYSLAERTRSNIRLCPISRDERAMLQIHLANEVRCPARATAFVGATRTELRWPSLPYALASRFRALGNPLAEDHAFVRNAASFPNRMVDKLCGALVSLGVEVIKRDSI